jgi:GTP-binding protein HflX
MREKLVTSHDTLYERAEAPVVTVFNKIDRLAPGELADKQAALSGLAPNPVAVSAQTGAGVAELRDRVDAELPDWERERLLLPVSDEAMSLVSWVYDHAHVDEESYADDHVAVSFEARPSVIAKARAKAADVTPAQ